MIISQTTTLIFEYPQDYLQEQEWCKTKEDRWIHKGTDTLGAVYENTISYSIGQPQTEPTSSKMEQVEDEPQICDTCRYYNSDIPCGSTPSACKEADKFAEEFVDGLKKLRAKTEPQNECTNCGCTDDCTECHEEAKWCKDEPQTERSE